MKITHTAGIACAAALLVTGASAWNANDRPISSGGSSRGPSAGTIKGKVEFEGEKPESKPLQITAEASKGCCPAGVEMDMTDESLLIDEKNGLANVVVTITVEGQKPAVPEKPVELDQKMCKFEPHVLVVPVGGKMEFLNSDEVSHNIHTYPLKSTGINQMVSAKGRLPQTLDKAETIKVACDIHTWMSSYVVVTEASAWDVTAADGTFEISGVPPGKYTLELWHEKLGKGKQEITVAEDGSADAGVIKMGLEKKTDRRRK